MARSPFTWLGLAGVFGVLTGLADQFLGLSYGIELFLCGLAVLVVLNLSHRYAGVPS